MRIDGMEAVRCSHTEMRIEGTQETSGPMNVTYRRAPKMEPGAWSEALLGVGTEAGRSTSRVGLSCIFMRATLLPHNRHAVEGRKERRSGVIIEPTFAKFRTRATAVGSTLARPRMPGVKRKRVAETTSTARTASLASVLQSLEQGDLSSSSAGTSKRAVANPSH